MKDFKQSVVYQIYPRSFKDSNGDGIGDLRGVIEKLDYLKELGVDYLWLTPFYVSPQRDNGYDIADYYNIDPTFGTMADFEELVAESLKRGMDLMLDMVFNHTSTEHDWFKKAMAGDDKHKSFYIWKDKPTNWVSKFGGNAWEYVEKFDQYYLHLFDVTQGDLNWENPEVREEIYKVVNFWLAKGVKGFRLDVINLISKPSKYEDDAFGDGRRFYTDGPKIHEYLKELNKNSFGKFEDVITVGEMSSTSLESCLKYSHPDEKELSMVFNFHHLKVDYDNGDKWSLMDFDFQKLKAIFKEWQEGLQAGGGWGAVFWCNHDQPRIVSRFGHEGQYHKESAKMLATTVHLMRGTPYIYQGEEIGMKNPHYTSIDQYKDVESLNYYEILKNEGVSESQILEILASKSRDNSRAPMQWTPESQSGFTTGTPWLEVGEGYEDLNVETALKDKNSVFYHYQQLIRLRKEYEVISHGDIAMLLEDHPTVLAYERTYKGQKLVVLNNFYETAAEVELPQGKLLLSNYPDAPTSVLRPYESVAYLVEGE